MATMRSRANQQYLSLILSNSRSSLKTPFHLRSRRSNGRGEVEMERVRARMARKGVRKWLRDTVPPRPNAHAQVFPFTLLLLQAQLLDPPSELFVS